MPVIPTLPNLTHGDTNTMMTGEHAMLTDKRTQWADDLWEFSSNVLEAGFEVHDQLEWERDTKQTMGQRRVVLRLRFQSFAYWHIQRAANRLSIMLDPSN